MIDAATRELLRRIYGGLDGKIGAYVAHTPGRIQKASALLFLFELREEIAAHDPRVAAELSEDFTATESAVMPPISLSFVQP